MLPCAPSSEVKHDLVLYTRKYGILIILCHENLHKRNYFGVVLSILYPDSTVFRHRLEHATLEEAQRSHRLCIFVRYFTVLYVAAIGINHKCSSSEKQKSSAGAPVIAKSAAALSTCLCLGGGR